MNLSFNLSDKLSLLNNTLYFFKKNFITIMALGVIAALGRVIQLGGFGQITSWMNIIIEVLVESARILIFLYVLGFANIKKGILRIKRIVIHNGDRKKLLAVALLKLKDQWLTVSLNIIGFSLIVWAINFLIDLLAYETCLYLTLKTDGILAESSSEWTILLFFKKPNGNSPDVDF